MEPINSCWLHFSVYCEMKNWKLFLSNCLAPFISTSSMEPLAGKYLIFFSEERGEHIQLSFQVTEEDAKLFLDRFSLLTKKFLSNFPPGEITLPPSAGKFMLDFPLNHIFYGLHQAEGQNSPEILLNFQQSFSLAIIEALKNEVIDKEVIETFYTYAGHTFFSAFEQVYPDLLVLIEKLLQEVEKNHSEKEIQSMNYFYLTNRTAFRGLLEDIRSIKEDNSDFPWLFKWKTDCVKLLSQVSDNHIEFAISAYSKILEQLNLAGNRSFSVNWLLLMSAKLEPSLEKIPGAHPG
jgi:hypothetical protein